MALISPGVQVTITDESFFIPAAANTVPLFFIATAEEKSKLAYNYSQTGSPSTEVAEGTIESGVVRTVTSLKQSIDLYGVPRFLRDSAGKPFHGDARNEYGLAALNMFLGVGDLAYVVRANVNLNDDLLDLRSLWDGKIDGAASQLANDVSEFITAYNQTHGYLPSNPLYKTTVSVTELMSLANNVMAPVFAMSSFAKIVKYSSSSVVIGNDFMDDFTATPKNVYALGYDQPVTGTFIGFEGQAISWIGSGPTQKTNCDAATTGNIVLSGLQTIDGVNLAVGNRVLVKNQTNAVQNGIYTVSSGAWIRAVDANGTPGSEIVNLTFTFVTNGTLNAGTGWYVSSPNPIVIGSSNIVWTQFVGLTPPGYTGITGFTPNDAADLLISAGDTFKYTQEFLIDTSLGPNDAARRATIVHALATLIQTNSEVRSESMEYNLILCPGYWELADEMINLNQDIDQEAFVIADTPMNMDPQACFGVGGWSESTSRQTGTDIAYYYPHALISNLDGYEILVPASGVALRTFTYTDEVAYPWFAPAGVQRGAIVGISNLGYAHGTMGFPTEFVPLALNKGQRNEMYAYTARGGLNPLVFFPGRGFLVWGQKTSTRETASALDRVNVSRLVRYLKRALRKGSLPFVFEPNDEITRNSLKALVDSILGDIMVKRGLYDFATICSTSNNTPDRIDRNELWCDVAIKPVKAAEFIYIPVRVVSTGASI
jgi:hypothetical protein